MLLVQVLDDGERLRKPFALIDERGKKCLRIGARVLRLAVLALREMDEYRVVRQAFQVKRDAHTKGRRAPKVRVKLHSAGAIFTLSSPTPSIPARSSSPGFTGPTPAGVPVKITSPGSSV